MPLETAAVSARSVCTIQTCTMSRHFMQSHVRSVHACLAATCYLHVWQNDRDFSRATAVKQGVERIAKYKSAQKADSWKNVYPRRSCRNSNLRPFDHASGALTTELSSLPIVNVCCAPRGCLLGLVSREQASRGCLECA